MKNIYKILVIALFGINSANAQSSSNVVIFSEDGEPFFAFINGVKQNTDAQTNVKISNLTTESFSFRIVFANSGHEPVSRNQFLPFGSEYTFKIKKDKKGKLVMKPFGQVELAAAVSNPNTIAYHSTETPVDATGGTNNANTTTNTLSNDQNTINQTSNNQTANGNWNTNTTVNGGGNTSTSTTTTSNESVQTNTSTNGYGTNGNVNMNTSVNSTQNTNANGENLNVNMNVGNNGMSMNVNVSGNGTGAEAANGVGNNGNVNMNVGINGMEAGNGTVTTTTTTTSTNSTTTTAGDGSTWNTTTNSNTNANPNYSNNSTTTNNQTTNYQTANTPTGSCVYPTDDVSFAKFKTSVESKPYQDTKMSTAKLGTKNTCLSTAQVMEIMKLFMMDDDKLAYAKYAYDYTTDRQNFYQLSDVFSFDSTTSEFNKFLETK